MIVPMDSRGRLTISASARGVLELTGATQFHLEVVRGNLVLRPMSMIRREDAWAYTPEHRRLLEKAHTNSREGRVRRMSEEELMGLDAE
jgi:hypothetical protein